MKPETNQASDSETLDSLFLFHPITLDDQQWVKEKLLEDDLRSCELTFANNFIWRHIYDVAVCQTMGFGIIRYRQDGGNKYSFPFGHGDEGHDKKEIISLLRRYCAVHGETLCMYPIEEEPCRLLKEWFPGAFLITSFRGDYDYIYTTEKLSTLKGGKLHGKRNHIARFMDEPDWNYEPLTHDNMEECRQMSRQWSTARAEKWNEEMDEEIGVLHEALDCFDELSLVGGVLRQKGQVVAFTVGEPLNSDTFVVHFEKAFPDLQGAYPMINQQFVLHACQDYTYVNREEDTGDLGLRRAKLSYCPDILLKKYNASESHVVYACENDMAAIRRIWQECFGDEDEYIDLYLKKRFESENMLVIHMDGKPVSMASFLPVTVTVNGEKKPARYIYAVATLPAYRERGYAAEILRFAADFYGEPLILQPAEPQLIEYYQNLGFREAFAGSDFAAFTETTAQETDAITAEASVRALAPVTPTEYKKLRDAHLAGEGYVEWDEDAIAYALAENEFCGGAAVKIGEDILLYRVEDDTLCIMETTLPANRLQALLPALMSHSHTHHVMLPQAGGMILWPKGEEAAASGWGRDTGYLGLTLG